MPGVNKVRAAGGAGRDTADNTDHKPLISNNGNDRKVTKYGCRGR